MSGRPPSLMEVTSLSAIEHILLHKPERITRLVVSGTSNPRVNHLVGLARGAGILTDQGRGDKTTEPVRALMAAFEYTPMEELDEATADEKRSLVVALDHLQDPQNFGAICRTAEALGVAGILLPKDRSVVVSPGVYAASVGAVETLPVVLAGNLSDTLKKFKDKGFWIVGAALGEGSTPPWKMPTFEKVVLVLGTEYEGLAPSIEKMCDWKVQIPLVGRVESLNVSVAGGILMYHMQNRAALEAK